MSKWLTRALALQTSSTSVPSVPNVPKRSEPSSPPGSFGDFDTFGTAAGEASPVGSGRRIRPLEIHVAEREAIAIELGDVPEAYAKAFAVIQAHPPPDVPRHRWDMFVNDAALFLDAWGKQSARLGWMPADLFGLDELKPMERYDRQGLLWMLKSERVIALTACEARLSGGLAYYRRCEHAHSRSRLDDSRIEVHNASQLSGGQSLYRRHHD